MFARSGQKTTLFLLILLLLGAATPVFAVELLGNWVYRQSGGDDFETRSEFQQRYQLGVGPALTLHPTRAITVSGGVGYRNTQRNTGQGFETVEQVSPFGQLSLANDIFTASLSANTYITLAGSETSTSFWNGTLGSAWDVPLWPNIRFNYGEDFAGVNKAALFDDSGGKNRSKSLVVDWDLLLADLYYEYNIFETLGSNGESQGQVTSHHVRFDTNGSFFADRLGYTLNQQYRETKSVFTVGDSDAVDGEDFFRVRVEGQTLSLVVDSVTGPDAEDVVLADNPGLSDTILTASAESVDPGDRGHFGLNIGAAQQVDTLFLYLSENGFIPDPTQAATTLRWDLYVRNPALSVWELASAGVPFSYNADEDRFELSVAITDAQIMVVTTNDFGLPLVFTELEAYRLITEDTTTSSTSYKTTLGLRYRISRTLATSFNMNYEVSEDSNGDLIASEYSKTSLSGRLQWTPASFLSSSLGYSEYIENPSDSLDFRNTVYFLTVATRPLSTVNVSLSITHNDRYTEYWKTYVADTYSLYGKFRIYPDLTGSISTTYTISDRLITDPASGEELFVNDKSLSTRLDVTARLRRSLTAYVSANHSVSDNQLTGRSQSAFVVFRLNYRPSDLLSMQSSYSKFLGDDNRADALNGSIELYLLRTRKARLSVLASHVQTDDTLDNFRMLGSWDVSEVFTLTTSGLYTLGPVNSYSFLVNLSMRL